MICAGGVGCCRLTCGGGKGIKVGWPGKGIIWGRVMEGCCVWIGIIGWMGWIIWLGLRRGVVGRGESAIGVVGFWRAELLLSLCCGACCCWGDGLRCCCWSCCWICWICWSCSSRCCCSSSSCSFFARTRRHSYFSSKCTSYNILGTRIRGKSNVSDQDFHRHTETDPQFRRISSSPIDHNRHNISTSLKTRQNCDIFSRTGCTYFFYFKKDVIHKFHLCIHIPPKWAAG